MLRIVIAFVVSMTMPAISQAQENLRGPADMITITVR